jgi:hypothetical protein
MMQKTQLISQTKNAFDFLQKLYFEVSYLIKEIEGLLAEEQENFLFGRGSGYAIIARSSNGLDTSNVKYWMYKKIACYFIPSDRTKVEKGQTITRLEDDPRVIIIRVVLDDSKIKEPIVIFGVFENFKKKKVWPEKLEQFLSSIDYYENKVFTENENVFYEDGNMTFTGKLKQVNLYDINNSDDITEKIIKPVLEMYRIY